MPIRKVYGTRKDGGRWEIFMLENATDDEQQRWWEAHDALFPLAGDDEGSVSE